MNLPGEIAARPAAGAGGPFHIVVVDDELTVCELLKRGLKEGNYQVTSVTDPERAAGTVEALRPCLVILDVCMPGKNGLEVLQEIKNTTPEVPVVLITGHADAADRDTARRLGACDLLTKPVNWNYLRNIAMLSSFLRGPK